MACFGEFIDVVVDLLVDHPVDNFDTHLSRWLSDQKNVPFQHSYRIWRQEQMNVLTDYYDRIRHLLCWWHHEHGDAATPIRFLKVLKGKPRTELLIDKIAAHLAHVEPGTR